MGQLFERLLLLEEGALMGIAFLLIIIGALAPSDDREYENKTRRLSL